MSDPFDLGSQPQPGDSEEEEARLVRATELAEYLIKHPGHGSVRYRVETLSGYRWNDRELDHLADLVEHLIDLHHHQQRSKGDGS